MEREAREGSVKAESVHSSGGRRRTGRATSRPSTPSGSGDGRSLPAAVPARERTRAGDEGVGGSLLAADASRLSDSVTIRTGDEGVGGSLPAADPFRPASPPPCGRSAPRYRYRTKTCERGAGVERRRNPSRRRYAAPQRWVPKSEHVPIWVAPARVTLTPAQPEAEAEEHHEDAQAQERRFGPKMWKKLSRVMTKEDRHIFARQSYWVEQQAQQARRLYDERIERTDDSVNVRPIVVSAARMACDDIPDDDRLRGGVPV